MRYQVGQKIIVIAFIFNSGRKSPGTLFQMPFMYNNDPIQEILFKELLVTEHHRIAWDQDPEEKKDHDGYLLTEEDGTVWTNQYPKATYGQIDTSNDQLFRRHFKSQKDLGELKDVIQYRSIESVYSSMKDGIRELLETGNEIYLVKVGMLKALLMTIDRLVENKFKKKFVSEVIWPEHPEMVRWVLQDIEEGA